MELICPSCASRFQVRPEAFASGPRKVRCARCSHVWLGEPAVEEAPPVPEPEDDLLADTPQIHPVETAEEPFDDGLPPAFADKLGAALEVPPLTDEAAGLDLIQPERRRTPAWVKVGWVVLILFVVGTVVGLSLFRAEAVTAWPPVERLYNAVDAVVSGKPESAVAIIIQKSSLGRDNGTTRMTIELLLENRSSAVVAVPVAAIDLIGKDGELIRTIHVRIPGDDLAAGESRPVPLVLDDVPTSLDRVRASVSLAHSEGN